MPARALAGLGLLLVACSNDPQDPPPGPPGCGEGQAASSLARTLSGLLTYDRVPLGATGLDYTSIARRPIRGAQIELSSGGVRLASATSDTAGRYSLSWVGPGVVTLRVLAATTDPVITVEDNTASFSVYSLASCVDSAATATADVHAPSGWSVDRYASPRTSGPFAILDTVYAASRAFLAERPIDFPPVHIAWSVRNVPRTGYEPGEIGSAHYDVGERRVYLHGKENEDTDEFDEHVVLHEWAHHLTNQLGRNDDGPGPNVNYHGPGYVQDPRVSWNEGWATAIAAIVLYPDVIARNTFGPKQAEVAYSFDAEADDVNGDFDLNPGWFSEGSVIHILFDLFDPPSASEPFDHLSLSLGEIYDVLVGPARETDSFATVFPFLHALKTARPDLSTLVDELSQHHRIGPVLDDWGTGEPNDAGLAGLLPVYQELVLDGPAADFLLALDLADLGNDPARFARFEGDGSVIDLNAEADGAEVYLKLFRRGALLAIGRSEPQGSVHIRAFPTTAGAVYTIALAPPSVGSFPVKLQLRTH